MYRLKNKDWPTLSDQTPVFAKYVGDSVCIGIREGNLINLIRKDGKYQQTRRVPIHTLQVLSISVPSDNSFIASTGMDGRCVISKRVEDSLAEEREIECPDCIFPHVAVSPTNENLIAICGNNGTLYIEKNKNLSKYTIGNDAFVDLTFFGPNSEYILAAGRHSIAQIDSENGTPYNILKLDNELKRRIHCIAAHPNSKFFAVGTFDRFVEFYEIDDNGPKKVFEVAVPHDRAGHTVKVIEEIMFMSDGKIVVVGASNGSVNLIDIEKQAVIANAKYQRSRVVSIAVSPDDSEIISVSDDNTVLCIDVSEE